MKINRYQKLETELSDFFKHTDVEYDAYYFIWTQVVQSLNFGNNYTFVLDDTVTALMHEMMQDVSYVDEIITPVIENESSYHMFNEYTSYGESIEELGYIWKSLIKHKKYEQIQRIIPLLTLLQEFIIDLHNTGIELLESQYSQYKLFSQYKKSNNTQFRNWNYQLLMTIHIFNIVLELKNIEEE